MELNKSLKYFAANDYKKKEKPKSQRSPRKQQRPRKSLPVLSERKIEEPEPLESSSDEETNPQNEQPGQSTPKTETNKPSTSKDQPTSLRQSQKKPNWYGQNIMVSKVEKGEKEFKEQAQSETKSEQIRRELE